MDQDAIAALRAALRQQWPPQPSAKAAPYIDQFFERRRVGRKLSASVEGHHGTYTVSIDATGSTLGAACSCYIGRSGYCHHCQALALTFLHDPDSFQAVTPLPLQQVRTPEDLSAYLHGVTLDELIAALQAQGITQARLAASLGMHIRQLSAIKASERRNRFFNELGATKVACLWMLEHFGRTPQPADRAAADATRCASRWR